MVRLRSPLALSEVEWANELSGEIRESTENYFLTRIPTNLRHKNWRIRQAVWRKKLNSHKFIREDLCVIRVDSCQEDFFSNLLDKRLTKREIMLKLNFAPLEKAL